MKINKQSNLYTVIYVTLLVAIVGTGLAFTTMGLRGRQQANENAEKMRQILSSVRITSPKNELALTFEKVVTGQLVVNVNGDSIGNDAFDISIKEENRKKVEDRELPVYVATIDGSRKYIIPVYGSGLWGPIWGYVSFNSDGSTIYGAYFDHEGETPGLGAEIEKPQFSNQFREKTMIKNGKFLPVNVLKKGLKPQAGEDYVDAVTGGTITSKGVAAMLDNGLSQYKEYLIKLSQSNKE